MQEVLDAFADGIESGEYDVLQKAQEAVEAIGYTFDYDLDGTMSDLRKMGEPKSYAKGGETSFQDKVDAIAKNLEGKKVAKSVQKDYGKRYSKKEALDSARRIVGAMKAKGMFK